MMTEQSKFEIRLSEKSAEALQTWVDATEAHQGQIKPSDWAGYVAEWFAEADGLDKAPSDEAIAAFFDGAAIVLTAAHHLEYAAKVAEAAEAKAKDPSGFRIPQSIVEDMIHRAIGFELDGFERAREADPNKTCSHRIRSIGLSVTTLESFGGSKHERIPVIERNVGDLEVLVYADWGFGAETLERTLKVDFSKNFAHPNWEWVE